jgi:hypothetical protein
MNLTNVLDIVCRLISGMKTVFRGKVGFLGQPLGFSHVLYCIVGAWGSVVVKALRY